MASHKYLDLQGNFYPAREEVIPKINNPNLTHIIIDDLQEQGVLRDKIWAFVEVAYTGLPKMLDRADVVLQYARHIRQTEFTRL